MSHSPYHYVTQPRHENVPPGLGDFDAPQYLAGDGNDYGMPWLLAIPAWAWLTGGAAAAGGYYYAKSAGASEAATAAASAQAAAAPPTTQYIPMSPQGQMPPSYQPQYPTAPPASGKKITEQGWFWPTIIGAGLVAAYLFTRPRRASAEG